MKVSNENIVAEFVRRFSQTLVHEGMTGEQTEIITVLARDDLRETLEAITKRANAVDRGFAEGVLDSRRPSKGMTGPFVESSQEPHTFAEHVHGGLRQEPESDIIDAEVLDED
jgi:hypothetical protein